MRPGPPSAQPLRELNLRDGAPWVEGMIARCSMTWGRLACAQPSPFALDPLPWLQACSQLLAAAHQVTATGSPRPCWAANSRVLKCALRVGVGGGVRGGGAGALRLEGCRHSCREGCRVVATGAAPRSTPKLTQHPIASPPLRRLPRPAAVADYARQGSHPRCT